MGVAANGPHPRSEIAPRAPFVNIFRNHPRSEVEAAFDKKLGSGEICHSCLQVDITSGERPEK